MSITLNEQIESTCQREQPHGHPLWVSYWLSKDLGQDAVQTGQTRMRQLSRIELATVQLQYLALPELLPESSSPAVTATAVLRRWASDENPCVDSGYRAARTLARAIAVTRSEFNEWIGWEMLRLVDADDSFGIAVTVDPDLTPGETTTDCVRLREYLPALRRHR